MKKIFFVMILVLSLACNLPVSKTESTPTGAIPTREEIPTETFMPAPISTPTQAFTPTPVPLFFTEEFNAELSAWTFFQTGGAQGADISLTNDALDMQMNAPHTWYYAVHNAHEYESVFVRAKFSLRPSGSAGVICDYSDSDGWYEFNISHEGTFSVLYGKWLAEGIAQYKPILDATSEYIQPGVMSYEIGLTCNGNFIYLHVNGKMFRKLDVKHIGLVQGKVGISAASFDNAPMNADFEWFTVSEPER